MSSILGRAPVLDFDGTIASLDVDWDDLRRRLDVGTIDDLWKRPQGSGFALVAAAEIEAAAGSDGIQVVLDALGAVEVFAVLTSNSEEAVHRFFEGRQPLGKRLVLVVGREKLGGPKTDFARFEVGLRACLDATAAIRGDDPPIYVADRPYELDFARRLGATAVPVNQLMTEGADK